MMTTRLAIIAFCAFAAEAGEGAIAHFHRISAKG
jgi:hypothetical protein